MPSDLALQWTLDSTVGQTIGLAWDFVRIATKDNVQPIALAACKHIAYTFRLQNPLITILCIRVVSWLRSLERLVFSIIKLHRFLSRTMEALLTLMVVQASVLVIHFLSLDQLDRLLKRQRGYGKSQ